ncbi:hypothetical protein [Rhizobium sp. BK068]|uniref:hypothetical protein n=1 Tax=Rhizobium sp. BK068 TaxID=2512130 RepID=UPI0014052260|nr:hypothetical protein [Rhizobium sp. BK068]
MAGLIGTSESETFREYQLAIWLVSERADGGSFYIGAELSALSHFTADDVCRRFDKRQATSDKRQATSDKEVVAD